MDQKLLFEDFIKRIYETLDFNDVVKIEHIFTNFKLKDSLYSQPHLLQHLNGCAKNAESMFDNYITGINIKDKDRYKSIALIGSLLHDIGKLGLFNIKYDDKVKFDSVETELVLRVYGLYEIAQSIRHNPYLLIFDLHNGLITIPQLIVAFADMHTDKFGNYVTKEDRLAYLKKSKKINFEFQEEFYELLERLYINKVIRTPRSKLKISFVERCDGRYPISDNSINLDKLSSYHIAKEIASMGYDVSIFTDYAHEFSSNNVNFYGIGNDILESYSAAKKSDITFITGWTSLFEMLKKSYSNLPILVMRSLKESSLTPERVKVISKHPRRVILVSQESSNLINRYIQISKNYRIIPNGINKSVFHYREIKSIKKQFVYVGAMVEEKGLPEVVDLARALPDYKCILIGSASMYGQSISDNKFPRNVEFLGELDHLRIADIIRESAFSVLFTNPEKIFETFGKVTAESQLTGCPVIYVENGGIKSSAIEHELNHGFKKYDRKIIVDLVRLEEIKFFNVAKRKDLSEKANMHHLSWREVATSYLMAGNIELSNSLKKLLRNKKSIYKYLYYT